MLVVREICSGDINTFCEHELENHITWHQFFHMFVYNMLVSNLIIGSQLFKTASAVKSGGQKV